MHLPTNRHMYTHIPKPKNKKKDRKKKKNKGIKFSMSLKTMCRVRKKSPPKTKIYFWLIDLLHVSSTISEMPGTLLLFTTPWHSGWCSMQSRNIDRVQVESRDAVSAWGLRPSSTGPLRSGGYGFKSNDECNTAVRLRVRGTSTLLVEVHWRESFEN